MKPTDKKHYFTCGGYTFWFRESKEHIECVETGSKIWVVSQMPSGGGGSSLDLLVADEICEWPSAIASKCWANLCKNTMAKRGLVVTLSTAQWDVSHVGYERLVAGRKILNSQSNDWTTLPIIYEVPEDKVEQWQDETWWKKVNPAYGVLTPASFYRTEFEKTKGSIFLENEFKNKFLNIWTGSSSQWLSPSLWSNSTSNRPESDFIGKEFIASFDYARRYDVCCYSLLFREGDNYHAFFRYFIPEECAAKKAKEDNFNWPVYRNKYNVVFTPGDVVDTSYMRNRLAEDIKKFGRLKAILYDPYGLEETRQVWVREGYETIEVTQNINTMAPAFAAIEEALKQNRFKHPDCPVASWMFNNCSAVAKNEKIMVQKASESKRMDIIDTLAIGMTYHLNKKESLPVAPVGQKWAAVW